MNRATSVFYWALGTIAGAVLLAIVTPIGQALQRHMETRNAPRTGVLAWDTAMLALAVFVGCLYLFLRGMFAAVAALDVRPIDAVAPFALGSISGFVVFGAGESLYRILATDGPLEDSIPFLYVFA